ncbi:sigma factor-like helix-turn-helix DNA-binding protein [Brevibacterium aurantiacum]|uniref:RNA polymerase sigma-70 region 4 domain-containing protein n=1 Tax=Brevibacterium aurantiacum TaxID=273384 RepID=A0A2A3ZAT7_BREAU|nr:sigma factor-like helix-turn-helix DNA-binding protein [Brevibacterium aurantiacum]PCC48633.1 hypothetical protein CIK62_17635 [Brevibacterium aurantiacum]
MNDDESRAACNHDHSKAEEALRRQPTSLEAHLDLQWDGHYAESRTSFDDRIADSEVFTVDPEQSILAKEHDEMINGLLNLVSERDAEVVRRRFGWIDGKPQTLEEIGQEFDVTRERIRQIVNNSIALDKANLEVWAHERSKLST